MDDRPARAALTSNDVRFSVVVPTIGRPTLVDALASIARQLEPGDELLVVCDASGDWGDSARNSCIARANGTHLVFLDDDDEYLPGALASMRDFARSHPGCIGVFKQRWELYEDPWHRHDLDQTASPMYCVPNVPGKVGRFRGPPDSPRRGDVAFIRETVALQGEPIWREERTSVVRPEKSRWRRLRRSVAVRKRLRRLRARLRLRQPAQPGVL